MLPILTIDNYDDSIEYADEQKSVMIETTSRQMIFDWAKDNGIILKRYKEDGYLAIFNERIYRKQVEVHFSILDEFKTKDGSNWCRNVFIYRDW